MRFKETRLRGVYRIELDKIGDDRGFFARSWCKREFEEQGLTAQWVQANIGRSTGTGTLRGMHYQRAPWEEVKLVRCTKGAVYDVAVDLRPSSASYRQWVAAELTADNHTMLYVPEGCAHGYLTLEDDSEIMYFTSQFYTPEAATGAGYDDPAFGIEWPARVEIISEQDAGWPRWAATGEGKGQTQ